MREIGSWRGHENSGRFVGSRPREEEADKLFSVAVVTLVNATLSGAGVTARYQRCAFCVQVPFTSQNAVSRQLPVRDLRSSCMCVNGRFHSACK